MEAVLKSILAVKWDVQHGVIMTQVRTQRAENLCLQKNLVPARSPQRYSQRPKIKTTSRWSEEQAVVCVLVTGYRTATKKERSTETCYNVREPWNHDAEWRNPATNITHCTIPCVWHTPTRQTRRDREQALDCQARGAEATGRDELPRGRESFLQAMGTFWN